MVHYDQILQDNSTSPADYKVGGSESRLPELSRRDLNFTPPHETSRHNSSYLQKG